MLANYLQCDIGNSGVMTAFPQFDLPLEPVQPEPEGRERRRFRTIWISDVHLGTKGCNADMLIDFLDHTDSETLYLGRYHRRLALEEEVLLARRAQRYRVADHETRQARHPRGLYSRQP